MRSGDFHVEAFPRLELENTMYEVAQGLSETAPDGSGKFAGARRQFSNVRSRDGRPQPPPPPRICRATINSITPCPKLEVEDLLQVTVTNTCTSFRRPRDRMPIKWFSIRPSGVRSAIHSPARRVGRQKLRRRNRRCQVRVGTFFFWFLAVLALARET